MRSIRPLPVGFTLIEVMIALAIAAGSLLLLLSSNRNSLIRSTRSADHIELEQACESKLDEIRCGAETGTHGDIPGLHGCVWDLNQESATLGDVENVKRLTLRIADSRSNTVSRSWLKFVPVAKGKQ